MNHWKRAGKAILGTVLLSTTFIVSVPSPVNAYSSPVVQTVAGNGTSGDSGDGGPATNAQFSLPESVVTDASGNLYISDYDYPRIRKVDVNGVITTFAGTGVPGYSGDGGPATAAQLRGPGGLAVDPHGNVYIVDYEDHRIRKVSPDGIITTIAGTGVQGHSGDNGSAIAARLSEPWGIDVDSAGVVYFVDAGNRVRKINTSGTISAVAGNGTWTYSGDGGPAALAGFSWIGDIAVDAGSNIYITDNSRVRKVDVGGTITTIAGTGVAGYSGDGGPATLAQIRYASAIDLDGSGNVIFADPVDSRIRSIDTSGDIHTIAGTGTGGYSGDGGPAIAARIDPSGLHIDSKGNVYFGNWTGSVVRMFNLHALASDATVTVSIEPSFSFTVAGRSTACNGQATSGFVASTTPTAASLGRLNAASTAGAAQDLTVASNAGGGFAVLLRTDGTTPNVLRSGSNSIADVSGIATSPGAAPAAGTPGFGWTSSDTATPFTSNTWSRVTELNQVAVTANAGTMTKPACVGYQAAVSTSTPAGVYVALVIYTAVPTF